MFKSILVFLALSLVTIGSSQTLLISGTGTIDSGSLVGSGGIAVSGGVTFSFSLDTSVSDTNAFGSVGEYIGAITGFSMTIDGQDPSPTFTQNGAVDFRVENTDGDDLRVFVLDDVSSDSYGVDYAGGSGKGAFSGSAFLNINLGGGSAEFISADTIPDPLSSYASVTANGGTATLGLDTSDHDGFPDNDVLAVTITGYTVSSVPEPSTYAAILGGLVLVGAMCRRRWRSAGVA